MPFQSVPDTAEAVMRFLQNGELCSMTFYANRVGGYTQTDIDQLAEALDTWAGTEFLPLVSSSITYLSANIRGLQDVVDLFAVNDDSNGAGPNAGQPLPNAACFCIARTSGFSGRSARGRVYWPLGTGALQSNENMVIQASADAYVAALEEVRVLFATQGWTEVIVSRQTNGAPRVFGAVFTVLKYAYTDLFVDSQRRRMPQN